MQKGLISIIIPIYKVEDYLEFCLNSIIVQSYKNVEIILIDDGSPDRCPEICDEFAKKDCRVLVRHKVNGGVSDARNVGLLNAHGEYIAFIDPDDFVDENYIELLYKQALVDNADIVACDYTRVVQSQFKNFENDKNNIVYMDKYKSLKNAYKNTLHGFEFVLWGKLFRRSLFTKSKVLFPIGRVHEDIFTIYKLFYYAKSITYISRKLYFYRKREDSIMDKGGSLYDQLDALEEACAFFCKNNESLLLGYALNAKLVACKKLISRVPKDNIDEIKFINNNFCSSIDKYLHYSKISIVKKIYYLIEKTQYSLKENHD